MNKRRAKGALKGPVRSQSNLWFVDPSRLDDLGPCSGWAGIFDREDVAAGTVGDPLLAAGYDFKWLWLSGGTFDVEVDEKGDGKWKKVVAHPVLFAAVMFERFFVGAVYLFAASLHAFHSGKE